MGNIVNNWLKSVQAWLSEKSLFSIDCLLCLQKSERGNIVCEACEAILPWIVKSCRRCALPLMENQVLCGTCLHNPPAYTAQALFHYAWPINAFIAKLKYQKELHFAPFFGELMATHLIPRSEVDCILPMPLHVKRQRERGFNQTIEIARKLAKTLNVPLIKDACFRSHFQVTQSSLSAIDRAKNISPLDFEVTPVLEGKQVLVVEDVVTTGATIAAFSKALKKAGVKNVEVFTCARA